MAEESKRLNDLPASSDEFWDGERYMKDMSKRIPHKHTFYHENARNIKCNCGVGFVIGEGDRLKEGHLYHFDRLVV